MVIGGHNYSRLGPTQDFPKNASSVEDKEDSASSIDPKGYYDGEKDIVTIREYGVEAKIKSISHQDHRGRSFYKPTSNRTWILTLFLLAIGLAIGMLEYLANTYPDAHDISQLTKRDSSSEPHIHRLRSPVLDVSYSPLAAEVVARALPNQNRRLWRRVDGNESVTSDDGGVTIAPNPYNQVTITTTPPAPGSPAPESQLSITDITMPTQPVVSNAAPESQLSITRPNEQTDVTFSQAAGSQITITQATSTASGLSPTASSNAVVTPNPVSVLSSSVLVSNGVAIATLQSAAPGGSGSAQSSIASSQGSQASALAPALVTLTDSGGRATATIVAGGELVLTNSEGHPTSTILLRPSSSTNSKNGTGSDSESSRRGLVVSQSQYFAAVYIPSIVGVILQSTWLVIFATFKLMEPFYALARPHGAAAVDSLTADYLSTGMLVSFSRAASAGHWVVILAGQIQFLLAIVVTFLPNTNKIIPTAYCATELGPRQPCDPRWVVNMGLLRTVEVILVTCFSLLVAIIYLNRRRVSGVYSDPSRIATMADLLVHDPLIQELRDIPPHATKLQLEHDLQNSRYMLGTFEDADTGRIQYGIIKLSHKTGTEVFEKDAFYKSAYRQINHMTEGIAQVVNEKAPYLPDALCMAIMVILFAMVLAYKLIPHTASNTFNDWMNSQEVGPAWVLTGLAMSVGFLLKRKERSMRLSHPYVLLAKGPQPAASTITTGTRATQFTGFSKGVQRGDISLALMSLCAIISDITLILIPGVPFRAAQTTQLYLISTYAVLALLGFVFLVHARVTFKHWQRGRIEYPETLAAGLMRLCGSQFVAQKNMRELNKEFEFQMETELEQDDEKKQHARYDGENGERRYRFGYLEGVDGIKRWMVEEDVWLGRRAHR